MDIELVTDVDNLVDLVNKKGRITFAAASKHLKVGADKIERWAELLDKKGIVDIEYPITGEPILLRKRKEKKVVKKVVKKDIEKKIKKEDHKDALLELLRRAPRISTNLAAKELKVGKEGAQKFVMEVMELEKEGYVKIEKHVLGKTFITRGEKFSAKREVTEDAEKPGDVKASE